MEEQYHKIEKSEQDIGRRTISGDIERKMDNSGLGELNAAELVAGLAYGLSVIMLLASDPKYK